MKKPSKKKTDISVDFGKIKKFKAKSTSDISVFAHCRLTGCVAYILSEIHHQKDVSPNDIAFIASCHDIGKISPYFQAAIQRDSGIPLPDVTRTYRRDDDVFHANISKLMFQTDFERFVLGWHHGFAPTDGLESRRPETDICFGGAGWSKERHLLLEKLRLDFPCSRQDFLNSWDVTTSISGLVIISDWISSDPAFYSDLDPDRIESMDIAALREILRKKVIDLGFSEINIRKNMAFKDVFGFEPRETQSVFIDSVKGPGVYILEAPMGLGKTEAALYASYTLLSKGMASGVYFALPTQVTSNKIHDRFRSFIEKITVGNNAYTRLLHGSAWLSDKTFGENSPGKRWFDGSRKGLLYPFAVGTVDQALLAVMNVKFGTIRDFGLSGKVVILDEVHSYDTYTGSILCSLVKRLRNLGCTVLILSATLTAKQKNDLLGSDLKNEVYSPYPLVTSLLSDGSTCTAECGVPEDSDVSIVFENDERKNIEEVLEKASEGQHVLWIENTVDKAQEIYSILRARSNEYRSEDGDSSIDVGLLHSRFVSSERAELEDRWVHLFNGKDAKERSSKGRILVGTQVLEQSLDIDADLLVSRFAPTDMILQRIGRLWRHSETLRPSGASRTVILMAPSLKDAVKTVRAFRESSAVYSGYVLLRSLEAWNELKSISIPSDIRRLLEATYRERSESEKTYIDAKNDLEKKRTKMKALAAMNTNCWGNRFYNDDDEAIMTRYTDSGKTVQVIVLKKGSLRGGKAESLDGKTIDLFDPNVRSIEKSRFFANCTVKVFENKAPKYDRNVGEIVKDFVFGASKTEDAPEENVRFAFVENGRIFDFNGNKPLDNLDLLYRRNVGYIAKKNSKDPS